MSIEGKVSAAFSKFREEFSLKALPLTSVAHPHQCLQMTTEDGLSFLVDGPLLSDCPAPCDRPQPIDAATAEDRSLWAVRDQDVALGKEECAFGLRQGLHENKIKHSNLTGGLPAYCAGEILFLDEETILVSGRSGRYGPRSSEELNAVSKAFKRSGYQVLEMGWDVEGDKPFPILGVAPNWVTS